MIQEELLEKLKKLYPEEYEMLLLPAYNLAKKAHFGQKRASGEEYFIHPCHVADILAGLNLDASSIAAALLHDVVEDTSVTRNDLKKQFGDEVCGLVDGVTNLDKIGFASKEEAQAENIRRMFFAMAKDVRVVLIKLADRLHNMRSLKYLPQDRQLAMSIETLDIYAPLAARLGISNISRELEDICLSYIDPKAYDYLRSTISSKVSARQELVNTIIEDIKELLKSIDIEGEVSGRPKHFYSIYKKMIKQKKTIDEIYDIVAVRIIVEKVKDCYAVLGSIHNKWRPIPGRIKDYIAMPKPNMYQSLHTTVVTNYGQTFEIQIRTREMHNVAEYGVAAHWRYKQGKTNGKSDISNINIKWLEEIIETEGDVKDSRAFYKNLKVDLVNDEVLVFTPKGRVVSLPTGSTPIDFAYHVHSEVGNHCVGAKINGKMVKLETKLEVGDVVEILTSANAKGPSWDWLSITKSSGARNKIRQFFKHEMKDENIKHGKEMLETEAKKKGTTLSALINDDSLKLLFERFGFDSFDEVCAAVGYGGLTTNQVLFRLIDYRDKMEESKKSPVNIFVDKKFSGVKSGSVIIKGMDNLLIRFAGCCNPVPGDKIVGFISRGRGVSVHRESCPNLKNVEQERLVSASWAGLHESVFSVSLEIIADDSPFLIANISSLVANMKINITAMSARIDKRKKAVINITVQISDVNDIDALIGKIEGLGAVNQVFRV